MYVQKEQQYKIHRQRKRESDESIKILEIFEHGKIPKFYMPRGFISNPILFQQYILPTF